MTVWDPVSKQPYFKTAACRISKLRDGTPPSAAPTTAASAPGPGQPAVRPTAGGEPTVSVTVPIPRYPNDPALATDHPAPAATVMRDAL